MVDHNNRRIAGGGVYNPATMRDHRLIDERSLAMAMAIAERLRQEPGLVQLARENIHRWLKTSSPGVRLTLEEWLAVLDGPVDGVVELLTSRTERATRLRQSNPFAGALSEKQRNAILLEFQERDQAAT
jgi:hypothetical protein